MQQLHNASNKGCGSAQCAGDILDAVPLVIRFIRREMRSHRSAELSLPQFRAILFLSVFPNSSLSVLADFLVLSLAATSRMVEGLVGKGLVRRQKASADRRQVALSVTVRGLAAYRTARRATQKSLAHELDNLSELERKKVAQSMRMLHDIFNQPKEALCGLSA